MTPDQIAANFQIDGELLNHRRHKCGHINDTFIAEFQCDGISASYVFQRINHKVFTNPEALMENILRVTSEARKQLRLAGLEDVERRTLNVIPATDGRAFHIDAQSCYWRCYEFIEGTRSYEVIQDESQAFEVARAFGEFQRLLAELPGKRLHETIKNFHNTRARFDRLKSMVERDPHSRLDAALPEWEFVERREPLVDVLLDLHAEGKIPERITHNDTKLNNVLIDEATQEGICVVDLDTVMPGLALYDFGDLVRTATSPASEDEMDLSRVQMQMPMFEALVRGYHAATRSFLTETEVANLVFAGKLITLETGIRFLTDHLEGDVYFNIHRENHNLHRARTQFALVESIESQESEMDELVNSVWL